ncbi:hypothetical protein C5468_22425 [Photorhabdus luminescens subsp. mexicana]|uniref:Uncharacterized protein n=1 Tax=Photorhabdus luminescens subsp. mexicana TaxID=2100167 RepID=A0A4R4IVJ9_PHOLU|nr:hypothetical protein C5468_22425 [Photorhabdus luminescens subsp. mexicana]
MYSDYTAVWFPLFHHTGLCQHSYSYFRGLLSDIECKNSWQLEKAHLMAFSIYRSVPIGMLMQLAISCGNMSLNIWVSPHH